MYKPELKEELQSLLMQFFKEEQNNRITSFNMNGLLQSVSQVFDKHKAKDKKKKDSKKT